tara:strand:+ start:831 stop:1139 length:309 start_codon:yes stop_codon:yes gene_type:complete
MNKEVTYKNRYGDEFVFKINERKNIQWSGNFEFHRCGLTTPIGPFGDNSNDIMMVDPSGGPYIGLNYDMGAFNRSFKGMNVIGFLKNDDGYELVINQNKDDE